MVVTIPRHDFPTDDLAEGLAVLRESLSWAIEDLEEVPRAVQDAFSVSLTLAESSCALDPQVSEIATWDAWVTAMQSGSALFAAALETEGTVQCRIEQKLWAIPASGPAYYTDAGNWITAFFLAVICREKDRMTTLCRVPISLLRQSGADYDEYIYAWIDALQSYWLRRPGVGDKLVAAVAGTSPETARAADPELMLKILYPPLDLFFRYLRQDHEQFNSALTDALRWHREYWTADEERTTNPDGYVALGPLAMACFAHDAGFPINVESEYLPRHLLLGSRLGEGQT
ncbi:immunity 49 family protein [Streptomyces avermitilis]|uniref:immunity 49 family protein n=1 Tax=Streptomyces avermitilis TaxID=33903 RepID=UPI003717D599